MLFYFFFWQVSHLSVCHLFVCHPTMQAASVVTWPQPMDGSIYPPVGNPCTYLLENALCYIISGLMLLVVGVIITSLTFQNLEDYKEEQINRYAGPVLIGAGILVIARGALSHLCPQRSQFARQRSLLRRYVRELYTRPIFGVSFIFLSLL